MSDNKEALYKDPETLERLYWYEGMSQEEIGDELDCSKTTVSKYMSKFNIETRDPMIILKGGEDALKKEIRDYIKRNDDSIQPEDLNLEGYNEEVDPKTIKESSNFNEVETEKTNVDMTEEENPFNKEVYRMDTWYAIILLVIVIFGTLIASYLM